MVQALLAGRKTMTRRLAWRSETWAPEFASERLEDFELRGWDCRQVNDGWQIRQPSSWQKVQPGDRLWVRENFGIARCSENAESGGDTCYFDWGKDHGDPRPHLDGDPRFGTLATVHFAADGEDENPCEFYAHRSLDGKKVLSPQEIPWRPSIHMPRWASRLTLIVAATKFEPLQDISEEDAIAEGVVKNEVVDGTRCTHVPGLPETALYCEDGVSAGLVFEKLWASIHGPESLDANPEVVAITFRVVKENIDRIKEAT